MKGKILSNLKKTTTRSKKRLGRGYGSNQGAKSGRGTTRHQKARTKINLYFEGGQGRMTKRYPLLRGKGKNKSRENKPLLIKAETLNSLDSGAVIDVSYLIKKGLVKARMVENGVKVVSKGKITKKLIVALPVSKTVKKQIEDQGGEVRC